MGALYLTEADVKNLLTMDMALDAVTEAHQSLSAGQAVDVPRQRTRLPTAALHILQGALLNLGVFGYKAYTSSRAGNRFLVHLFDAAGGQQLAMLEADYLGMMRTGAAGGVAARQLAQPAASRVGLIGAGWQAPSQLEALCRVRPIAAVAVYCRDEARRQNFCQGMSARLGISVSPATSAESAVRGSEIIVTITTAAKPVLEGAWLEPGCHVNAAGANALIRRELDEKAVQRADLVCVDSRATALVEAGDLLPALEKGRLHERQLVELGDLLTGIKPGRQSANDITLFESQGLAVQDLALARRLVQLALERGVGQRLP